MSMIPLEKKDHYLKKIMPYAILETQPHYIDRGDHF